MVTFHDHPPPASKWESPREYPVCLATSYLLVANPLLVVRDTIACFADAWAAEYDDDEVWFTNLASNILSIIILVRKSTYELQAAIL